MEILVVVINLGLTYFFVGGFLPKTGPFIAIVYILISIIGIFFLRNKEYWTKFVNYQLKSLDNGVRDIKEREILISAAFLALGMKIGTALALAVAFAGTVVIAFCILLASGFIIEGRKSGMSVGGAWTIAKVVVKVYNFINGVYDSIVTVIVKIEFKALKIDIRTQE